jgi:predicted DNA-binding protein
MAKIQFSARKDPLLPRAGANSGSSKATSRPRSTRAGAEADARPAAAARAGEGPARTESEAVEGPDGVVAVSPPQRTRRTAQTPPTPPSTDAPRAQDRHGRAARRVQTSMSLPPDMWDGLDELGRATGVSAGELLTVILEGAVPDSPAGALAALEQLLGTIAPDEGLQEERNFRIPLTLRAELDALTDALGRNARVKRSLLIRALLVSHTPTDAGRARELITARRIDSMRAALHTGSDR